MIDRKYIFRHESDFTHYTADAFVVRCFDNRFWPAFHRYIKSLGLKHIDVESVAGGAKIFSSPEKAGDRGFMLRELEKSIHLHHTKKVILFTHQDCGAYGGSARFSGDQEEKNFHTRELRGAEEIVSKEFPNLVIETYFIDKEGIVNVH